MLDLTLQELKDNIYIKVLSALEDFGFEGNKDKMWFRNYNKERKVLIEYDFNDYSPLRFEFIVAIAVSYPSLSSKVKKFYNTFFLGRPVQWNFCFTEREFNQNIINEKEIYKKTYYNPVYTLKQSSEVIDESITILKSKILPFLSKINNVYYFQDFISKNLDLLKENLNIDSLISFLLASRMKSTSEFNDVVRKIDSLLSEEKNKGNFVDDEMLYVQKLKLFIMELE